MNNQLASQSKTEMPATSTYKNGKFYNSEPVAPNTLSKLIKIIGRTFTDKSVYSTPKQAIPVSVLTKSDLENLSDDQLHVIKLGHSSILLKIHGEYWLLDPVFAERASPFSFMGPKRFHDTPITLEELPNIERVLISHNHYDHLDKQAVKKLANKTNHFFVPLGVGSDLEHWGVKPDKITEFDWWQEQTIDNGLVAFTPTRHFSGRALSDGNKTLWGSWVIKHQQQSLYFSGDSGYFSGFKDIGNKYGPFDLTMIETGAYDDDWSEIHMTPEQSVQAHIDVQGKQMMPIHNGTFDLAFHAWFDPLERVFQSAKANKVSLFTPIVGDINQVNEQMTSELWWRKLINSSGTELAYELSDI